MTKLLVFLIFTYVSREFCAAEGPDIKHGVQVLRKMFKQFLNSQPEDVKLSEGVHLVSTRSINDARAMHDDGTLLGVVENYLKNHEVRIRIPELMPGEDFGRSFKEAIDNMDSKNEVEEARRKGGGGGGGGGGGMMMMGLMMGKLLAALGIGGVALLAKKALMVSALALMLSIIIGLKKLVHHDHDEGGHTVIHASHGHGHEYRRKRDSVLPYSAWDPYNANNAK